MGNPRKTKDKKNKASKTRATPRKEESAMARAGEEEEASTSQVEEAPVGAGVSGDVHSTTGRADRSLLREAPTVLRHGPS